jgi:hypothetical protein
VFLHPAHRLTVEGHDSSLLLPPTQVVRMMRAACASLNLTMMVTAIPLTFDNIGKRFYVEQQPLAAYLQLY